MIHEVFQKDMMQNLKVSTTTDVYSKWHLSAIGVS